MKFDRLLGILTILLQKDKVTAPELAARFEVSRRTICRDIEDLCQAGIPIVTAQGRGGGISVMDGYRLDKTLLAQRDMQAIIAGLSGLDSVTPSKRYEQLMERLTGQPSAILAQQQHVFIDLSSWYRSSLAPRIELLQEAIEQHVLVRFSYCGPAGESLRTVEPYLLVFRWSSWYLWAFCRTRQAFRLFKLNRMLDVRRLDCVFLPREVEPVFQAPAFMTKASVHAVILVEPEQAWRLVDEFGRCSFTVQPDGKLRFCFDFYDEENLISWLFSFADQAVLLEPASIRERVLERLQKMWTAYEKQDS